MTNFVQNGSILTAYHDIGRGEPFVLLHGFTGSKLDFHDQLGWFADKYRVLAPDQRGHGESTNVGSADDYRLSTLATDLAGFLTAVGAPRCHLLGHSMGGMVSLRFALRCPERLRSLILMDTAAEPRLIDKLVQLIGEVESVSRVRRATARWSGQRLLTQVEVDIPGQMNVLEADRVRADIQQAIRERVCLRSEAFVRISPVSDDGPHEHVEVAFVTGRTARAEFEVFE